MLTSMRTTCMESEETAECDKEQISRPLGLHLGRRKDNNSYSVYFTTYKLQCSPKCSPFSVVQEIHLHDIVFI